MAVSEKLLHLLREVVAARANHVCEYPGCRNTDCDPHHVGGRGNNVLYDPDTCLNLCTDHHTSGPISAHGTPEFFRSIIVDCLVRSEAWFWVVSQKKNMIVKDADARQEWGERLQKELKRVAA